jgi:hypothetical protein
MTPIEKKVSTKKITPSTLASPIAAASLPDAPRDAELGLIGRGDRREMRPTADEPARIGDRKDRGEGEREPPDVVAEQIGAGGQNGGQDKVSDKERAQAAEACIGFRGRRERRRRVGPHRRGHKPAKRVRAEKRRQQKDAEAQTESHNVFAEPGRRRRLDGDGCLGHFRPFKPASRMDNDLSHSMDLVE